MDNDLKKLLEDDNEDALLARIQEESLRYYNEVELPQRAVEEKNKNRASDSCDLLSQAAHCSKTVETRTSPLKEVFYKGSQQGAEGFHLAAGETYVYPTNYPIRKYQQHIIHSALFHNTLVSLPTGLGKTFIGAVVMYNYYRWFPQGKIVFMAPTKPLVAQQIRACHNIMAIPIRDTIEMTGVMSPVDRLQHWKTKRVFFLTPQVMANDLRSGICPAKLFKCVVIDEAHRATKEYSFCHVIKELEKAGAVFRVLALSATPGSNIKAVIEVVQNLRISTLELRGENSPDVAPYTHGKEIEQVSLSLNKHVMDFVEQYLAIFERYTKNLRQARMITSNVRNLSRFQLLKASEKIRLRPPNGMSKQRAGLMMADFMVCIALAHGLELLQTYGLRAFYQHFTGGDDKQSGRLNHDAEFQQMIQNLRATVSAPMDKVWSHPKHEHLVKILKEHFCRAQEQGNDNTKVIIFCQYRVVVTEVFELLLNIHPLIRPVMFIGQGVGKNKNGLPQKKQIEVMKHFREGRTNVMIATCVAEEGLDIGSVDLLVLMEVQRSPVRLVQRLGRTGRHRQGRCVVLLTQGKEVQKFLEAMATRKSFVTSIQNSPALSAHLYKDEPTMVPPYLMPKMQLVHISVPDRITPAKQKKQSDIRQSLLTKLEDDEVQESGFLSSEQLALVKQELNTFNIDFNKLMLSKPTHLHHRINDVPMSVEELFAPTFCQQSEFNDWNRVQHETYLVSHSSDTQVLCHMLNTAEAMLLGHELDFNSQNNIGSTFSKKIVAKRKDVNANNDNIIKKKKSDNAKKYGMDIRACMALAADKIRLTQDIFQDEDKIVMVEDVDDEINIGSSQPLSPLLLDNNYHSGGEEFKTIGDCSVCKPFLKELQKGIQVFPISDSDITTMELLVSQLTKDKIISIDLDSFVTKGFNNGLCEQMSTPIAGYSNEIKIPQKVKVMNTNCDVYCYSPPAKGAKQNLDTQDTKEEYFYLEDIFNENDDFDLCSQRVTSFPVNSTPIKDNFSITKTEAHGQPTQAAEKQRIIGNANIKYTNVSNTSVANKCVFKIPQMESLMSPLGANNNTKIFNCPKSPILSSQHCSKSLSNLYCNNNLSSPESPILSGHISNYHKSLVKSNLINHLPDSEPPILSGQVLSQHKVNASKLCNISNPPSPGSPVLSGHVLCPSSKVSTANLTYNTPSPNSPILSGQMGTRNGTTHKKTLERKVLFTDFKSNKNDNSLCMPLENKSIDLDETSLMSFSQLFDEDSDEKSKQNVDLDKSSMYTVSQMVEKVKEIVNKDNPKSTYKQSTRDNDASNKDIFGSSDEDSIFGNIDLDAITGFAKIPNVINKTARSEVNLNLRASVDKKNNIKIEDSSNKCHAKGSLIKDSDTEDEVDIGVTKLSCKILSSGKSNGLKDANEQQSIFEDTKLDPFSNSKITTFPSVEYSPNYFNKSNMKELSTDLKGLTHVNSEMSELFHIRNLSSPPEEVLKEPMKCGTVFKQDSIVVTQWLSSRKSLSLKPKPTTSTLQLPKKEQPVLTDSDSNNDVILSPLVKKTISPPLNSASLRNKKVKKKQGFVELEADVSGPPGSSDEENTSGLDDLDESFINDMTERALTCFDQTAVDMHARYLQSVKSPVKKIGGYKIPVVSESVLAQDVFSQEVDDEDDSYERDSFCCDATEIPLEDELSVLEIAEKVLEKKKKSKKGFKRRRKSSSISSNEDTKLIYEKPRIKKKCMSFDTSSENESPIKLVKGKRKRMLNSSSSDSDVTVKFNLRHKHKTPHLLTSEDSDSDRTI